MNESIVKRVIKSASRSATSGVAKASRVAAVGRHPSRRRLQTWLDSGRPRRIDRHVAECRVCQEDLDELSALDDSTLSDLVAATEPPEDLTDRVADGVDTRLRDEASAAAFADLFTIGWDFMRCIVDPSGSSELDDLSELGDLSEPGPHVSPESAEGIPEDPGESR